MNDQNIRNLTCAIVLQAAKDYCNKKASPERKAAILKDLRSKWMDFITEGTSVVVAEQLEKHPQEIAERVRQHCKEED